MRLQLTDNTLQQIARHRRLHVFEDGHKLFRHFIVDTVYER